MHEEDCTVHVTLDKDIEIEALRKQAEVYKRSVREFVDHETLGRWYSEGEFYKNELDARDAYRTKHNEPPAHAWDVRKYDATEDLAFLYTELGKIYSRICELEGGWM